MKIGVAQIDCRVGDVAGNLKTITSAVEQAAKTRCDLLILPELADTGYDMDVIRSLASSWDCGPCIELCRIASSLQISLICGLSERDGDRIFNTAAIIDNTGTLVGKYRKTHLFSLTREDEYFASGDELKIIELGGFAIGIMICYDLRFPEMARALVMEGADILAVPAAWPDRRIDRWNILTAARAIENQVFLAAANRAGTDGPTTFGGNSCLYDPWGSQLAGATLTEKTLLTGEISRDQIEKSRASMRVFEDRRPELYGPSIRPGRR